MSPNLTLSLFFLRDLLLLRLSEYLKQSGMAMPPVPVFQGNNTPFTRFVQHKSLSVDEFVDWYRTCNPRCSTR